MPCLQERESTDISSAFVLLHVDAKLTDTGGRYATWNHNNQSKNHVVRLAQSFDHVLVGVTSPFILVAAPNSQSTSAGCTARDWLAALNIAARAKLNAENVSCYNRIFECLSYGGQMFI